MWCFSENADRVRHVAMACCLLAGATLLPGKASAQFTSGSTGADGALDLTGEPSGEFVFDPSTFLPPLDPEGDNIYHFTTITVPADVTVKLRSDILGGPVYWLATGNVQIDGMVDLTGDEGNPVGGIQSPALPGPGGYAGGVGGAPGLFGGSNGFGPGGGRQTSGRTYGGAYGTKPNATCFCSGGGIGNLTYGSAFVQPLVGGSGGAGGDNGGGGGGGGGALLIASSTSIVIDGTIDASGGDGGGSGSFAGSGGSGGAVRLVSAAISGAGALLANGGETDCCSSTIVAGLGRIRIEAETSTFSGTINGSSRIVTLSPVTIVQPSMAAPSVRVVSVDGQPVPPNPMGGFTSADVTIDNLDPVNIEIEAANIPLGTTVQITIYNETDGAQVVVSDPLAGTLEMSTATVTTTISPGFSLATARATWTP